jgi:hypothetical protein
MNARQTLTRTLAGLPARALLAIAACVALFWFWNRWQTAETAWHRHDPGMHGGTIVAVGHEHYHVEALVAEGGMLKLFTLGQDQSRVITVPAQPLTAYVRTAQQTAAAPMTLTPTRQPSDPAGQTSAFEGSLPAHVQSGHLMVVVPSLTIGDRRYRLGFSIEGGHELQMPVKVTDQAERDLYLTAQGKLTADDIRANGSQTASQKYSSFRSTHDAHPAAGDAICPITGTKANPTCTWVIGGQKYLFCCPPCIDEFVKLAKQHPEKVRRAADYVQK